MAVELIPSAINLNSGIDTLLFLMILCLGMILFSFALLAVWWVKRYNHTVVFMDVLHSGQKIVTFRKAREYIAKDGLKSWQLLSTKSLKGETFPTPPVESIMTKPNGKKLIFAYRNPQGQVIFAKENAKYVQEIPPEVLEQLAKLQTDKERKVRIQEWHRENMIVPFQPIEDEDRQMLFGQISKAFEDRPKKWTEFIIPLGSMGTLALIIIVMLVFAGDAIRGATAPAIAAQTSFQEAQKEQGKINKEIVDTLALINTGVQRISGSSNNGGPPN